MQGGGNAMTDTTKHPGLTIIALLIAVSTVDWAADCLANLIGGLF